MTLESERIRQFDSDLRSKLNIEPWRGELAPRVETEESLDGITRSLIRLQLDENEWVEAYLLKPHVSGREKLPAMLAIHQHGGDFTLGKSEPAGLSTNATFHYGIDLAKRGFVVLCPDLLGFEERTPPEWKRKEGSAPDGFWYERFEAMRFLLQGSTLQAKYLAELSRALDYLSSLDFVDSARIGVIGHSMGGQEAVWLSWYDKRVAACACSCGIALLSAILRDQINHNMALYVPGMLEIGDIDLLTRAIAPRPLFISYGARDPIFPVDSVRQIVEVTEGHYAEMGAAERFQSLEFPGEHGFPEHVKERMYGFLRRALQAEATGGLVSEADGHEGMAR